MTPHYVWGAVVTVVTVLLTTSLDQWALRRYPPQQSIFKVGNKELRVTDSEQLLPLAKACGMIPETGAESASQTSPEANAE